VIVGGTLRVGGVDGDTGAVRGKGSNGGAGRIESERFTAETVGLAVVDDVDGTVRIDRDAGDSRDGFKAWDQFRFARLAKIGVREDRIWFAGGAEDTDRAGGITITRSHVEVTVGGVDGDSGGPSDRNRGKAFAGWAELVDKFVKGIGYVEVAIGGTVGIIVNGDLTGEANTVEKR
jgi:hypothetical protein